MVEVILEAGVNHNGRLDLAYEMVDLAADSGADTIKFQMFSAEKLVSSDAPLAPYQVGANSTTSSQRELLRKFELSLADWRKLWGYCRSKNIEFLTTAFDNESIAFLFEIGQRRFKIPSGEITNIPLLRNIGRYGCPVLVSTGMSTIHEIDIAINTLVNAGVEKSDLVILHCTSEYPAPIGDVNLSALSTLREQFDVQVGYSDHTLGSLVAISATALGAKVLEKHFTTDKNLPGPDHKASLGPEETKNLIRDLRLVEAALGDGQKRPMTSEMKNMSAVRRSIVAKCAIKLGEPFTEDNLELKRPGTGVGADRWDEVIGRNAARDFREDELIEL